MINFHENFGSYMIFSFLLLGVIVLAGWGLSTGLECSKSCGNDPVARCYTDRAMCVGMDKPYIKPIK